jgi:hypothetical protein
MWQYKIQVEIEKTSFQLVLLLCGDELPRQHTARESSTDVFCDLLPETKEGIRVDSRNARITKQAQVLLTL